MKYAGTLVLCFLIIVVLACSNNETVKSGSSVQLSEVPVSSAALVETIPAETQLAYIHIAEHSAVFSVGSFEFTLEVASSSFSFAKG